MVAPQSVLKPLVARALTCALAIGGVAHASDDSSERYRALTAALQRSDFDAAIQVAATFSGEDSFARKAHGLLESARFLRGDGATPTARAAIAESGALRLALAEDFAFSASVIGPRGFTPLLASAFDPFSSRLTVSIDGEAFAPRPTPVAVFPGGARVACVERDVEIVLDLRGGAPPTAHPAAEAAGLRVEATLVNRGGVPRALGMRLLVDLASGFDDAPALETRQGDSIPLTSEWLGDAVPRRLAFGTRSIVLRGVGVPAPERVTLVPLALALSRPFDFAFAENEACGSDSALALFAVPVVLAPGQSRKLAFELVPNADDLDSSPPLSTQIFQEPVAADPAATRVLLVLRHDARGVTGELRDVTLRPRVESGLRLVSGNGAVEALGDLPIGEIVQRSWIVAPTGERGGALEVAFDVGVGPVNGRVTKTVSTRVGTPNQRDLAGRIVDVKGTPIPGAQLKLFADGRELAAGESDGGGNYRFGGLPIREYEIRASKVVHREPAAKAARADVDDLLFDIVLTSETVESDGSHRLPRFTPGEGRDVVLARSLTRFSVLVVTQWDASRDYLELVARGMRKAAEFLYAASDGQLTFGRVAIRDCALDWNSADLWDWSNNSVHPNASVAGIRHRFHPQFAPWNTAMNFGRNWTNGTWEQHVVYSTVVHEFGHYGFGLFDEYLGAPQGIHRGLSYPEMCRCIMGFQYADFKICYEPHHHAYTNQGMFNGRSCWKQLEDQYEGWRTGVYVPVLTPIERNGVLPPPIQNSIGDALKVVIRDESTGGFVSRLELLNPYSRAPGGIPVAIESGSESVFQGVTRGDGSIDLMGVHVGDRVVATWNGARAEFVVRDRSERYRLEFGDEQDDERAAPRIAFFPERVRGSSDPLAPFGTLEIVTGESLGAPPRLFATVGAARSISTTAVDASATRFVASIPAEVFRNGRAAFDCEWLAGDGVTLHAVLDVVVGSATEALHAFDGSLEFEVDGAAEDAILAVTSVAGPPERRTDAQGIERRSVGRVHALTALPESLTAGRVRFRRPYEAESRAIVPSRMALGRDAWEPVSDEELADGSREVVLAVPCRIVWFEE